MKEKVYKLTETEVLEIIKVAYMEGANDDRADDIQIPSEYAKEKIKKLHV